MKIFGVKDEAGMPALQRSTIMTVCSL